MLAKGLNNRMSQVSLKGGQINLVKKYIAIRSAEVAKLLLSVNGQDNVGLPGQPIVPGEHA